MKKICLLLSLLFVLIACSETNENADVASNQKLTNSTQTATTAEQSSELDFSNQANLIDAIDEMYDWQSYKSDYSFQYIVEGIEHFNIIETEYIVEPKQKHTFISTPYFEEEYYAIENDGVYSYKDYTEQWEFDENTDVSLENDIYYSQMLLRLIVENSLENTTVPEGLQGNL